MDGYEYLRQAKVIKAKYRDELYHLMEKFIYSNISFKVGDIVEVKNMFLSGRYIVDKIYMKFDDDFDAVQSPSCYIHTIEVIGRKLDSNGKPVKLTNGFKATDVLKNMK